MLPSTIHHSATALWQKCAAPAPFLKKRDYHVMFVCFDKYSRACGAIYSAAYLSQGLLHGGRQDGAPEETVTQMTELE